MLDKYYQLSKARRSFGDEVLDLKRTSFPMVTISSRAMPDFMRWGPGYELNKIQPFKSKEMYGFLGKCPAIHTFVSKFCFCFFKFLNGCILFNNTKLEDFVKLGVLFLNIWVLCY